MSEIENEPDYETERDPIPEIDLPVWMEDIILLCGRVLVARFIKKNLD